MNTSSFLNALRTHPSLALVLRSGAETVLPGFHLTEVKRVSYETVDCGAMPHRWFESQFEISASAARGTAPHTEYMPAGKFLRIVERVEAQLPLEAESTARVFVALGNDPAALFDIASISASDGRLWVELLPDRTRCKAAERQAGSGGGSCCGSGPETSSQTSSVAACACGLEAVENSTKACCA